MKRAAALICAVLVALGICLLRLGIILVIEVEIVVTIEDHEPSTLTEDPHPFTVSPLGILQIPDEVPGDHEIEGSILKIQVLGIHPDELRLHPSGLAIGLGLIQHGLCVINRCDPVTFATQYDREESWTRTDVEDLEGTITVQMTVDDVQPMPGTTGLDSVHDGSGITLRPHRPIILYVLEMALHRIGVVTSF